jgi:hypothetical protein
MFSRELHCRLENGKITDVFFTQVSTLHDFSCRCPFFHLTPPHPRKLKIKPVPASRQDHFPCFAGLKRASFLNIEAACCHKTTFTNMAKYFHEN